MKLWWYNEGRYGYVVRAPNAEVAAQLIWRESLDVRLGQYEGDPQTVEALAGLLLEISPLGPMGIFWAWTSR